MINFPETDAVLEQLKAFLSKTSSAPSSAPLENMRALAQGHIEQLTSAVTIGFAGEFGTTNGKQIKAEFEQVHPPVALAESADE